MSCTSQILSGFVKWCQIHVCDISTDSVRRCRILSDAFQIPVRYMSDTCQTLSCDVKYMFEIPVRFCQIMSGGVRFCQVRSHTCFNYHYRCCQMLSDYVRYMSYYVRLCQVISDTWLIYDIPVILCQLQSSGVSFCQILSGGVRYSGASSSKGSTSSNSLGPAQGPSSRVLHKAPW